MIGATYSIIRSHRGPNSDIWEKAVESGLDWETAKARSEELNSAEILAHPEMTSWVRDLFYPQMEKNGESGGRS